MSNRTAEHARSVDAFFFQLGNGAATENWMAGGSMGDVVAILRREGHLSDMQYAAAARLLRAMRRAHGSSGGIVGELQERVQTSIRERIAPPGGGDPDAFALVDRVLSKLRRHERELLGHLIVMRELPRGGSLADRGRARSGFEHTRSARACTTGQIVSLLDTVVELSTS